MMSEMEKTVNSMSQVEWMGKELAKFPLFENESNSDRIFRVVRFWVEESIRFHTIFLYRYRGNEKENLFTGYHGFRYRSPFGIYRKICKS